MESRFSKQMRNTLTLLREGVICIITIILVVLTGNRGGLRKAFIKN